MFMAVIAGRYDMFYNIAAKRYGVGGVKRGEMHEIAWRGAFLLICPFPRVFFGWDVEMSCKSMHG